MNLTILYRGPLKSCNYRCVYCPLVKQKEARTELAEDRQALARFVEWVAQRTSDQFAILFTPWGEALIRPWYQQALVRLSHLPHVDKVAIQTNLSAKLDWIEACQSPRLALWTTFHPDWISRDRFLAQCAYLDRRHIRFSVGMVGLPRFKDEAAALRRALPPHVYMWINAVKSKDQLLSQEDARFFAAIDPLFHLNTHCYASYGRACRAGSTVISVDGTGTIRPCHFIQKPLGNIYDPGFATALYPRTCPNQTCHCHIGYVHLEYLEMDKIFGSGILERIPHPVDNYSLKTSNGQQEKNII